MQEVRGCERVAARCVDRLVNTQMAKSGVHFRCPQHYCSVCGKSGDGVDMVKCIRCPTAYHSCCMPKHLHRLGPSLKVRPLPSSRGLPTQLCLLQYKAQWCCLLRHHLESPSTTHMFMPSRVLLSLSDKLVSRIRNERVSVKAEPSSATQQMH